MLVNNSIFSVSLAKEVNVPGIGRIAANAWITTTIAVISYFVVSDILFKRIEIHAKNQILSVIHKVGDKVCKSISLTINKYNIFLYIRVFNQLFLPNLVTVTSVSSTM